MTMAVTPSRSPLSGSQSQNRSTWPSHQVTLCPLHACPNCHILAVHTLATSLTHSCEVEAGCGAQGEKEAVSKPGL
jgi:hypothetical protein